MNSRLPTIVMMIIFSGCASVPPVKIIIEPNTKSDYRLVIGKVDVIEDGIQNKYAGPLFPMFKVNANVEVEAISTGLQEAFSEISPLSGHKELKINVTLPKYLQILTNGGGASMSCVQWQAITENSNILYKEQFYALSHSAAKDFMRSYVVNRIAQTAYNVSVNNNGTPSVTKFANTFNTYDEAITHLPSSMSSNFMSLGLVTGAALTVASQTTPIWNWVKCDEN